MSEKRESNNPRSRVGAMRGAMYALLMAVVMAGCDGKEKGDVNINNNRPDAAVVDPKMEKFIKFVREAVRKSQLKDSEGEEGGKD